MIFYIFECYFVQVALVSSMVYDEFLAKLNCSTSYLFTCVVNQFLAYYLWPPIGFIIVIDAIKPNNLNNLKYELLAATITNCLQYFLMTVRTETFSLIQISVQ